MKSVVIIGAGNLATHLAAALQQAGYDIRQVFSRTEESASRLGEWLHTAYTTDIGAIQDDADFYIFAVKDAVLRETITRIPSNSGIWIHTAGSMPMEVFSGHVAHYGVIYPLQTFSRSRQTDMKKIPFFIEASDTETQHTLYAIARQLGRNVKTATSEQRKYLHLAAVFACNFTNHLYAVADHILQQHGFDFSDIQPLIDETAAKVHELAPVDAQTGPAVRYDENILQAQAGLLDDDTERELYLLISKNIHKYHQSL
ncbi:MAG: DUF2520 domain-containing protein [Coprobacter sp.]|nr:DUF2520 domain-containing protein [Coprobacter sp.]